MCLHIQRYEVLVALRLQLNGCPIFRKYGYSGDTGRLGHLGYRWLVDHPGVTTALWGARRPEQLELVGDIEGWSLDQEACDAIDEILGRCIQDPVGPEFMAQPSR